MTSARHLSTARGITLIEALVALLVLALGMLAVARLQPALRQQAELARQRSEALRLAQADLERLRSFESAASGPRSYDAIASVQHDADGGYRLTREVDAAALPNAKAVRVTAQWLDRSGSAQQVTLASVIAGVDPLLAGVTALKRPNVPAQGAAGRAAHIPLAAKDLGDGRSVFKPVATGNGAIVFDNRSGLVVARCTGIAAGTATAALSASDLSACTSVTGMLLSGEIRFSAALPPDASAANDTPLPLTVSLALDGAPPPVAPWCEAEAMKVVAFTWAGSQQIVAVPLDATPASYALAAWSDRGERLVAYHCVVVPPVGITRWSGRTELVPTDWAIGTGAGEWRVCRFSRDLDGSGAIDANVEHPAIYQNVAGALTRQNFLVVRGSAACPASADTNATVPHQPSA